MPAHMNPATPAHAHEQARRAHLQPLLPLLQARWPQLRHSFEPFAPLPGTALVLLPARAGSALGIQAVSLMPGGCEMVLEPFPAAGGTPHWYICTQDFDTFCTCDADELLNWLHHWLHLQPGHRPPVPALQLSPPPAWRSAQAPWLLAWQNPQPATWLPPAPWPADLPADVRQSALQDAAALDAERLARQFPRQLKSRQPKGRSPQGHITKGSRVSLATYGAVPKGPNKRQWVLNVHAPAAGQLQLSLDCLIAENQSHDWQHSPWRWRADVPWPDAPARWGTQDDARAPRALAALDAGQYGQALTLYGITHGPDVARVLHGQPLGPYDADHAPAWAQELAQCLARLAPWRLAQVAPLPTRSQRLLLLSGQTRQRKAALVLQATGKAKGQGRAPALRLDIEYTGSNNRLPEAHFWRDADQDLARF